MIRWFWRLLDYIPLWRTGDLLDEEILTEIHIVVPKDGGRPKLFASKQDDPTPLFIQTVTGCIVGAAVDWARLYDVNVAGFLGAPACPHCGKLITGPPQRPPQ
jgi:hypothetical protein